jgi:hypothetical protein
VCLPSNWCTKRGVACHCDHEHYDRPFKFLHFVSILQQLSKFDPESGGDYEAVIEIDLDDGQDPVCAAPAELKPTTNYFIGDSPVPKRGMAWLSIKQMGSSS